MSETRWIEDVTVFHTQAVCLHILLQHHPGTSLLWLPAWRGLWREALGRGKAQRETSPWPEHQGSWGSPPELVRFGERAGNHHKVGLSGWAAWVEVAVYVFWNRVRGGTSNQPRIRKQISVWVEVRDHTWTQRWGWGHRGTGSMDPQVAVSPFRISSIHFRLRDGVGKGVQGSYKSGADWITATLLPNWFIQVL